MRAPILPSAYYRERGMRPVRWMGLVLWLTPAAYASVRRLDPTGERSPDATPEQVAEYDRWYELTKAERARESAEWKRLFRLIGGADAP